MAADQRRKRLNGASVPGCSSREQYRMKKKKMESLKNDLSNKFHISLEWDGNHKKVVAKREQIGISWRGLRPFIDSIPHCHNILADVFGIPQEIFELNDLAEVLSYEVWQTHLSENERNLLMQFLPRGSDIEQVVHALLAGDNFHFGNPSLKWGTSVCSGNLHPDAVLQQEQCLKADKKAYYSELQKYHNDIIGYLQKLKEGWESCKDPENEIVQKIWSRSRRDVEKRISSQANEATLHEFEQDVTATSESCSWVADEKACSSDNPNSSAMRSGELQKRLSEKGFVKDKCRNPVISSDDLLNVGRRPKKGDKLLKRNIHHVDGAKYMSYFKISKKQLQLVQSMKQSGKSIQSKSLNRVLGNLDSLHVQPYEVFVEEEQRKLHEHWLRLANEDLTVAYANWKERQLQRGELTKSLEQDMKNKLKSPVEDEEKECSEVVLQDQKDNGTTKQESNIEDEEESVPGSPQNQSPQQISSLNGGHEFNPMDVDSENGDGVSKSDDTSSNISEYSGNLNTADIAVGQGVPLSSGGDVWPVASMPDSYYDSTASHEYTPGSGLSLVHPQVNEQQRAHLIDLESDLHEGGIGKEMLHKQSDDGSLSCYPNQDRNELLQSLFKGQGMLSYHHEQKRMGLDFQRPNDVLVEDGNFPGHFQEQLQPSLPQEQGQKRQNEVYMEQNISENVFSDRGRHLIPRQEHLPPGNVQDWTVNPLCMSAPLPSHLNGGDMLSQNWFPSEHQVRGGWTGSDGVTIPSQSFGNGSNADQSLFSVLSHCSQLRSGNPYDSMGSTEQFISSRNYGMVGGGTTGIGNALPQAAHPLDYLGGRDAATSMMPDHMGWMNLAHQNSDLHDPLGKPYLRSWNQ